MSLVDAYHVHLGFWTNWDHGKIEGATITLTRRNGGLLVAFIAIFIGAAGKSFWRLACFLLHRMLSKSSPQDGIYHQVQAVLRNSDTAQDAAWSLSQVLWAWRIPARLRKTYLRLLGMIILALLVSISFGIAGVFSSQITTDTANEVLLEGSNCGPLDIDSGKDPIAYSLLFSPYSVQRVTAYSNYAQQCYMKNATAASEDCHPYVQTSLKATSDHNASCPFASEMCKSQIGNLIVDSGLIDSNKDLGINAPPENRFQMRFVHQCAPVVTEGYSNVSEKVNSTDLYRQYWYGNVSETVNYTQEVSLNETDSYDDLKVSRSRARADYGISVLKAYGGSVARSKIYSMFEPIPQLHRDDADVMLFFLTARGILYNEAVNDPWFSAHRDGPKHGNIFNDTPSPSYLQDEPLSVLGCTMQMQICNPNLPEGKRCERLRGFIDNSYQVEDLYESESQKQALTWANLIFGLGWFSISGIVDSMGISSLIARQNLANNFQGPLPDNQWQLEVENWVGASMASLQGSFVESGNGPTAKYQQFRTVPNNTAEWNVCKNQKIMTTKYSSFSVLGVGLILVIGGGFIFLDLTLVYMVDYVSIQRGKKTPNPTGTYARLEWDANTTLQLQRLAHEQIGVGTWSSRWGHPITAPGEKLAMVDVADEEHTLFVAPQIWEGESRREKMSSSGSGSSDMKTTRADTFDTVGSIKSKKPGASSWTGKKIRRVDTKTTLVNESSVGEITPISDRRNWEEIMRAR